MKKEVFQPSEWLIYKAAYMFYKENLSQKEIAADLEISSVTVSRLIQRARTDGIISFVFSDPYSGFITLANLIKKYYGLDDVIIAYFNNHNCENLSDKQAVALEGARFLQRTLTSNDLLGIGWGKTMYYLINYLNPCQKVNASFITMHGSISQCDYDLDVLTLTSRAAMAFGGNRYCLVSNGLLDSQNTLNAIKSERSISKVYEMFNRITVSISGLGSHYPKMGSPLSLPTYLPSKEYQSLMDKNVYGDILIRFFDQDGKECESDISLRTLAMDFATYRKIPKRVLVVSGIEKIYTLDAALRGDLCSILIIDDKLAKSLIHLYETRRGIEPSSNYI